MILYNLRCRKSHLFEAWFHDSAGYDAQVAAGEVACPICGSRKIEKALMAPRLGKGSDSREIAAGSEPEAGAAGRRQTEMRPGAETRKTARALELMRRIRTEVETNFDYVGGNFAEEARRIHYGETDPRNIYGETSDEEASALKDEGVAFGRIPWPASHDS